MPEIAFIRDGKLFRVFPGHDPKPVASIFADQVLERESQIRRKTAWKANTMPSCGGFNSNCSDDIIPVRFSSVCVDPRSGQLHYTLYTDTVGGVFSSMDTERRIIHTNQYRPSFLAFEPKGERIACAVEYSDGTSHLALLDSKTGRIATITDGDVIDTAPCWHTTKEGCLIFQSTGIARDESGMPKFGPTALRILDLKTGQLETVLESDQNDYLTPRCGADGTLFYIQRPYQNGDQTDLLKRLIDLGMAPLRLMRAIGARLNYFSLMYTGKPLTRAGGSALQRANARKVAIWGNLLEAETAAKFSSSRNGEPPSMVPKTWKLVAQSPDGNVRTVSEGVLAFDLAPSGEIAASNGSVAYLVDAVGSKTTVVKGRVIQQVSIIGA